jgi:hypothetical protein
MRFSLIAPQRLSQTGAHDFARIGPTQDLTR